MPAMVVWRALCASRGSGGWARKDGVSREREAECIGARGERGAGVYIYRDGTEDTFVWLFRERVGKK